MKIIEDLVSDTFILVYGAIALVALIFIVLGLMKLRRWAHDEAERDNDDEVLR